MSLETLRHIETCHETLIQLLESDDLDALNEGILELQEAINAARYQGAWRELPEAKERALRISALAQAAMMRVNFLTDVAQERLVAIEAMRGRPKQASYGRRGQRTL